MANKDKKPTLKKFLVMDTKDIASLVNDEAGSQVCVFVVNGTRRWFTLTQDKDISTNNYEDYKNTLRNEYIRLYKLCFDHGINTILTPVVREALQNRDEIYKKAVIQVKDFVENEDFKRFYEENNVSVHFYGDYLYNKKDEKGDDDDDEYLKTITLFQNFTEKQTLLKDNPKIKRLFYGLFASDATETVASLSIDYYKKKEEETGIGAYPTRAELVKLYYGDEIDKVTLYVNFGEFKVFDYPLLNMGDEDLYFTAAPTPYLDKIQLRKILYDHIYMREREDHKDRKDINYSEMSPTNYDFMKQFYDDNVGQILGIGLSRGKVWFPEIHLSYPKANRTIDPGKSWREKNGRKKDGS